MAWESLLLSQGKELLKRQPWIVSGVKVFLIEIIYRELVFMVGVLFFFLLKIPSVPCYSFQMFHMNEA